MSTPHNKAKNGDIAKTVLMPGDPLRAKYIADNFLEDVVCFNKVRNMFGYTGTYKGKRISVMGSGMGMPSIGIYSYELYKFYDVDNIIRIGSAGAYLNELNLFDIVLANDAYSESTFASIFNGINANVLDPSTELNNIIEDTASQLNYEIIKGRIHSSDVFYHESKSNYKKVVDDMNCYCVEMESFALFANAKVLNKNAACIVTISDSLCTHQETTPEQREKSFNKMITLALESAIKL